MAGSTTIPGPCASPIIRAMPALRSLLTVLAAVRVCAKMGAAGTLVGVIVGSLSFSVT